MNPSIHPSASPVEPSAFRRVVWPLAIAQTLIWAAMYYSFAALLLTWERDLDWSKAELSGAFTGAIVVSALLAPVVGRIIDCGYGTQIFTGSVMLGALGLILLSGVTAIWHFYVAYLILGVAMAGALYEACFAILTKTMGTRSKQAITIVALVAGFAGTLSFPGNHLLVSLVGWRSTMLILAAIVIFISLPLIWLGARTAERFATHQPSATQRNGAASIKIASNRIFWLLALGYATIALNHGTLLTHLLPLLDERGIPSGMAVLAASMIGPMQVAGRMLMLAVERRVSSLAIFVACFIAMSFAALSLLQASRMPIFVISFVILQGSGYGVTSILRPVVTADLLGQTNYGFIAGLLAVPFQGAAAVAPTVAALIWGIGGYTLVIWFALGAALLGLFSLLAANSITTRPRPDPSAA